MEIPPGSTADAALRRVAKTTTVTNTTTTSTTATGGGRVEKPLLPVASVMDTAKVRGTRSSRLREEQHRAAASQQGGAGMTTTTTTTTHAKMSRTTPMATAKQHSSASSASSNHSTPHTTSVPVAQPVPPLSLSSTQPKGKLGAALAAATRNSLPAPIVPAARAKSAGTTAAATAAAVAATTAAARPLFHDADPSPSSVPSRTSQPFPSHSLASSTSTSSASSTASISLFSMPPTISSASPRLTAKSMSILNLRAPSPSVPSGSSGKFTSSRMGQRASLRPPPQAASLSTAQRAVLEDIHIIADWLSTVQHSEPQHLLQFRSVIQRMKKVIFTPAQVTRSRARQKERIAAAPIVYARLPTSAAVNVSPLQRRIAALHTTPLLTLFDLTGHHHHHHHHASDSPRTDDDAVPPDYAADDSDYDELDGGLDDEFESKLSSFIRKTTKRDEDVLLKSGGTGSYPHAAGVAFENGRWVQKHDSGTHAADQTHPTAPTSHHTNSAHANGNAGTSGSHSGSSSAHKLSRFASNRSYSSEGITSATSECSDYEEGALDDIPDFSQTRHSGLGFGGGGAAEYDPSSGSPSSVSQKMPYYVRRNSGGSGSANSLSFASGVTMGRARASSNSQSQSYTFSGPRSGSGRAGGASSVSANANNPDQMSPGFGDDSEEVSTSMRSDSPSHTAISVSGDHPSQSVFSRDDREMLTMFGGRHHHGENELLDAEGRDAAEQEDDATQTLLPQGRRRGASSVGPSAAVPLSPQQQAGKKLEGAGLPPTADADLDALDNIPDFDDAPPDAVASVASVRPGHAGGPALAPFPFAASSASVAAAQPGGVFAPPASAPAPAGPTLITMQGWHALGRPASIDANTVAASGGLSAVALAVLANGAGGPLALPSAPSDPATEALFVKAANQEEFPDELDFGEDDEPEQQQQQQQQQQKQQQQQQQPPPSSKPVPSVAAKMVVKPVAKGTTGGGGRATVGSKMQTFTTLPASLKLNPGSTMMTTPPLKMTLTGPHHQQQQSEDDGLDEFDSMMSPGSASSAASSVLSSSVGARGGGGGGGDWSESESNSSFGGGVAGASVSAAAAAASKFDRIHSARLAKTFNQRTLAKKKTNADAEDFPSDLDDLSDADWSDEDRSEPATSETSAAASASQPAPNLLGPASRALNEFDLTPSLSALFEQSQRNWEEAFDGGFHMAPGGERRRRDLLATDGMTNDLRGQYVAMKFDVSFLLMLSQSRPTTATTASGAPHHPPPTHRQTASSGSISASTGATTLPPRAEKQQPPHVHASRLSPSLAHQRTGSVPPQAKK